MKIRKSFVSNSSSSSFIGIFKNEIKNLESIEIKLNLKQLLEMLNIATEGISYIQSRIFIGGYQDIDLENYSEMTSNELGKAIENNDTILFLDNDGDSILFENLYKKSDIFKKTINENFKVIDIS